MKSITLLIIAIALIFGCVFSEEVATTESTETQAPSDVSFSYIFPDYQDKHFPAGAVVEVLVGFTNNAESQFNISHIFASLNHAQDMRYHIQNYTRGEYGITVQPGRQATLAYRFVPDERLEPRIFGLLITLDYQDSTQNYTYTFFNSTINIVDKEIAFDVEKLFLFIFLVGIVGLIAFVVYSKVPKSKKQSRSSESTKSVRTEDDDEDWLVGTTADPRYKFVHSPKLNTASKKNK
ncbi:translocon-associated protein TRAP alpha subunit [Tieghemostelium lacteum]|uniref:Translocon-associated protein TRAP alpha subunit n=1 Tax=Tieghemostelium lacteum TaxID=361077 RepID=A0A151ZHA3_TIELA|nr:translocon-associated protein TRAP alpha subunit [Tieghemostelium lacteum]|eukprot:KYQ93346.1 translocon-associated protein TRAP alpha subunit [Tieghemostelium lacteum]